MVASVPRALSRTTRARGATVGRRTFVARGAQEPRDLELRACALAQALRVIRLLLQGARQLRNLGAEFRGGLGIAIGVLLGAAVVLVCSGALVCCRACATVGRFYPGLR